VKEKVKHVNEARKQVILNPDDKSKEKQNRAPHMIDPFFASAVATPDPSIVVEKRVVEKDGLIPRLQKNLDRDEANKLER